MEKDKTPKASLICCPEQADTYCTAISWKASVIVNMYRKSEELGIQNNTDESSLQNNQLCLGGRPCNASHCFTEAPSSTRPPTLQFLLGLFTPWEEYFLSVCSGGWLPSLSGETPHIPHYLPDALWVGGRYFCLWHARTERITFNLHLSKSYWPDAHSRLIMDIPDWSWLCTFPLQFLVFLGV